MILVCTAENETTTDPNEAVITVSGAGKRTANGRYVIVDDDGVYRMIAPSGEHFAIHREVQHSIKKGPNKCTFTLVMGKIQQEVLYTLECPDNHLVPPTDGKYKWRATQNKWTPVPVTTCDLVKAK